MKTIRRLFLLPVFVAVWATSARAQVDVVRTFEGTYNGLDQEVVAAPGMGKRLCLRSLALSVEDSATDWQFKQKLGVFPTPTPIRTHAPTFTPTPTRTATPTATRTPTIS